MNRSKGLLLIIILLLLSNMVAWYLVFFSGSTSHKVDHQAAFRSFLQKEVKFSNSQLKSFDSLMAGREEIMKKQRQNFREARKSQSNALLQNGFGDSVINANASLNAEAQKEMEIKYWKYFRSVRDLCTNDQLAAFDTGWYRMMSTKRKRK